MRSQKVTSASSDDPEYMLSTPVDNRWTDCWTQCLGIHHPTMNPDSPLVSPGELHSTPGRQLCSDQQVSNGYQ